MISSFGSLDQVLGQEWPDVHNPLNRWSGFEDLNRQRDMRDSESLHKIHCQLLQNLSQYSLLLVHRFLISPHQSALLILLKSSEDLILGYWQLHVQFFISHISRRRAVRVYLLSHIYEGVGTNGKGCRQDVGIVYDLTLFGFLVFVNLYCFWGFRRWFILIKSKSIHLVIFS